MTFTVNEIAEAVGCSRSTVRAQIKAGRLHSQQASGDRGHHLVHAGSMAEIKGVIAQAAPRFGFTKPTVRAKRAVEPLPAKKDLFRLAEAAQLGGISTKTLEMFLRSNNISPLKDSRTSYVPRVVVEKIRETFRKPEPAPDVAPPKAARAAVDEKIAHGLTGIAAVQVRMAGELEDVQVRLAWLRGFLERFAKSVGYSE